MYVCDQKITVILNLFKKYLFINSYLLPFKVTPLRYNTLMLAFFSILETLLIWAFWYCQQLLFRFFFYLLNRSKRLSFHRCVQFFEEEKVSGGQVQWLRLNYGFVFSQKLKHKRYHGFFIFYFSTILCVSHELHNWSLQSFSRDYWPSFSHHLCCVC